MNFDYNFENADYLTTLDSIRSNLYKVTANINLEIFSLNKVIKNNNDPDLVTKKEKLEACLASIIELTDSLANTFVDVDKLIGGNQSDEEKENPLIEEAKKYNSEILSEVIKKTKEDTSKEKEVEETEEVEAPTGVNVDSIEEVEAPQEEIVEEKAGETNDEIKIPEESPAKEESEVVTNAIEPPIEATKEDAVEMAQEVAVEAPQEEVAEEASEPVSEESVYVANKIDTGVSRAILVTDDQYKKLEASIDSQIALCKFRNLLVGKEVVEDKDDLESLMEKANQLYQDGNIEEAEKLYNKISELSKNGTA